MVAILGVSDTFEVFLCPSEVGIAIASFFGIACVSPILLLINIDIANTLISK